MSGLINLLSLHEAIVIAIINLDKEDFQASFDEIAEYIEKHNLFPIRKGNISLSKQIELRSTQAKGQYKYLFEHVDKQIIRLRPIPKSSIIK